MALHLVERIGIVELSRSIALLAFCALRSKISLQADGLVEAALETKFFSIGIEQHVAIAAVGPATSGTVSRTLPASSDCTKWRMPPNDCVDMPARIENSVSQEAPP